MPVMLFDIGHCHSEIIPNNFFFKSQSNRLPLYMNIFSTCQIFIREL